MFESLVTRWWTCLRKIGNCGCGGSLLLGESFEVPKGDSSNLQVKMKPSSCFCCNDSALPSLDPKLEPLSPKLNVFFYNLSWFQCFLIAIGKKLSHTPESPHSHIVINSLHSNWLINHPQTIDWRRRDQRFLWIIPHWNALSLGVNSGYLRMLHLCWRFCGMAG